MRAGAQSTPATHNTIVGNCLLAFRPALRSSDYQVYTLGILLVLREGQHYTYPDLLVCPATHGPGEPALMRQPYLLLDVLDPETADLNRARKYPQYRQLPSLRHHLLVWQTTRLIEWYQLAEHSEWSYTALTEAEDAVVTPELGVALTVARVYGDTCVVPMRVAPPAADLSAK